MRSADVIVVGGGVIGLATANELAGRGLGVRVLERGTVGSGASHGNCGLITPSHCLPLNRPGLVREVLRWMGKEDAPVHVRFRLDLDFLAWGARFMAGCRPERVREITRGRATLLDSSRDLYEGMIASEGLDVEWETAGLLEVCVTEQALEAAESTHHALEERGATVERLGRSELLEREPALRDEVVGGALHVRDAQLRPEALVRELARVARSKGVAIDESSPVRGFGVDGARVTRVVTDAGELSAGSVVVATGAWSPRLGRELGVRIPVQPGKGYSITIPRPERCPRHPLLLVEAGMAVTPWASGCRLGGTMELSGYDERMNRLRLDALRAGAARYLREPVNGAAGEEWCGWRPMTPDELPILDRVPGLANAYLATGHGMMGVSMAPATASVVAALVTGEEPFVDITPYSLARFG